MSIIYKVTKCRNPRNPDAEYYKGTAVKNSDYTFENLAEDVSLATTVTKGDAMAVLAERGVEACRRPLRDIFIK